MAEQSYIKQQLATCPQTHTWVDASAGTGKTKILTDRILRFLIEGTPPSNILALTFTRAAAAEMKSRILDRLAEWAISDSQSLKQQLVSLINWMPTDSHLKKIQTLFTEVLDCPGGLKIQTIHRFCQDLLSRFPLEAGIPLHYTLLTEIEALQILRKITDQLLRSTDLSLFLEHHSYAYIHECLLEIVMSSTYFADALEPSKIRSALQGFLQVDLSMGSDELLIDFSQCCPDWQSTILELKKGSLSDQRLAELLKQPHLYDHYFSGFLTQEGEIRQRLISKKIETLNPSLGLLLKQEAERIYTLKTQLKNLSLARYSDGFYQLSIKIKEAYQKHKKEHALIDFNDLIFKTNHLLHKADIAPWILYKLDYQIDHILIDEAQDNNPLQWQVMLKLAEDFFVGQSVRDRPRTIFVVGDCKQSIYSFQGADSTLFTDLKKITAEKAQQVRQQWQNIHLDVSFRSCQTILNVVDATLGVYEGEFALKHKSNRPLDGGRVELWPLVKEKDTEEALYPLTASQKLARKIAEEIKKWLDDSRLISAKGRSATPKDIMILVQRRHTFMYELIRALKKKRVPVAGPDRMLLLDQLYIQDLLAFGRFLLLPDDDYNLACLLKSPLFNFSEEELFDLCYNRGGRTLWGYLNQQSSSNALYHKAQTLLSFYLDKVDYLTPYQLYAHLFCVSQGRQKFFARFGDEIADGLDEFLNLVLTFESESSASLELFMAWIMKQSPEIKRDFSNGDLNAVRITTVHGAKGLEAPIIILPDTTFIPQTLPALLWEMSGEDPIPLWSGPKSLSTEPLERVKRSYQTKQEKEYRRLLYVALTRAEDELYICGWETDKEASPNCWYHLIRQGMLSEGAVEHQNKLIIDCPHPIHKDSSQKSSLLETPLEIPNWLFTPAKQEKVSTQFLSPSQTGRDSSKVLSPLQHPGASSSQDGQILHKLLELLPSVHLQDRSRIAEHILNPYLLSSQKKLEFYQLVEQVLDDPTFKDIFGPHSFAEVPIAGYLNGEKYLGRIDRLVVLPQEIKIIDFKSDQNPPPSPAFIDSSYRQQLLIYKQLLQQIYPHHKMSCQILWIRTKTLMIISEESEEIRDVAA